MREAGRGRIPVVVDCDPGIDDALALALLAASPEFDLRAVTTVCGNVTVDHSTRNAIRTLAACDRPEVPVCQGATRPLVRSNPPYAPIHGLNGVGDVELAAAPRETSAEPALAAFERVLEPAAPGEITVIALAPLTNIALLLAMRPDLADRIGLLAVMGATIDRGNVTPFAEFNVWADPEAAFRVLAEGEVPTRLFTLAATRKAAIDEPQRLELATWSPIAAKLAEMILGYDDHVTGAGWPLHDAMVVAGLLEPGIAELREAAAIAVDTTTGPRRGATTVAWADPATAGAGAAPAADDRESADPLAPDRHPGSGSAAPGRPRPLEVAIDADPVRFWELLLERIGPLASSRPA
ncbi:MAG TPA: nucleoside hydrolase [Solirubrobacterales bacterium]|nr:nucleoside hydrolase [Solirubrobacterales bacterium]